MPSARSTSAAASIVPKLLLVVLCLLAVLFAALVHRLKSDLGERPQVEETEEIDPFAHIPREPAPTLPVRSRSAKSMAQADLRPLSSMLVTDEFGDPRWAEALEEGRGAEELMAQAGAARQRSDESAFREHGKQAREAFDRAFGSTAELELELLELHGEADPRVRRMMSVRAGWQEQLLVLRHSVGR